VAVKLPANLIKTGDVFWNGMVGDDGMGRWEK